MCFGFRGDIRQESRLAVRNTLDLIFLYTPYVRWVRQVVINNEHIHQLRQVVIYKEYIN